jgi:hypothetical protein
MRGILTAGLLVVPGMLAQTLVEPARVSSTLTTVFTANPVEQPLRCEVTPVQPTLDFRFRFQAGYSVNVPMEQYLGPKHGWAIFTRVTPPDGKPAAIWWPESVCPMSLPRK